jgi:hypothetical protein
MANYVFDPSAYAPDTTIASAGWTIVEEVAGDTWTVVDVSGENLLQYTRTGSTTGARVLSLNAAAADPLRADSEMLVVFQRTNTTQMSFYLAVRRDETGANMYNAGVVMASNPSARTRKVVAETSEILGSTTVDSGKKLGIWCAFRARIVGTTLQTKLWFPADSNNVIADEPVEWSRTNTDADLSAAGITGFYQNDAGGYYIKKLAIATGGDTASFTVAPDVDPPILTNPEGTATGATTCSGNVTTNEGTGTLYYLITQNSTETATTVKSGQTKTVTESGLQTVTSNGLSASTSYYIHFLHRDAAGNDSLVASSASFETQAAPSVPPAGTVTIGTITTTSTTAAVPFSYDASDADGFEYRIDSGVVTTVPAGTSPLELSGLTEQTSYTVEIRAFNEAGAGTWSALANFTTAAAPIESPKLVIGPITNNTGTLLSNLSNLTVYVHQLDGNLVFVANNEATDATGFLELMNELLVQGTQYRAVLEHVSGAEGLAKGTAE